VDLKTLNIVISVGADLSDALPLFALLCSASTPATRWLKAYFSVSFLIKLVTIILVFGFEARNTMPFYHLLAPAEFILLFMYYKVAMGLSWRPFLTLSAVIVITFNVVNTLFFESLLQFNAYSWSVNTLGLMVLSFAYLYQLFDRAEEISLRRHTGFLVNAGLLLYFGGTLFTYILGWKILSSQDNSLFANGWIIQGIVSFFKNVVIAFAVFFLGGRRAHTGA